MITRTLDLDRPSDARVHDYLLGGGSNFAADRALARHILAAAPHTRMEVLAGRDCMRRMVRTCLDQGIRQFLDLGSGIPAAGGPHEIIAEIAPDARVVYVDNEQIAATQGELLLGGSGTAAMVHADVRDPETVLAAEGTRRLLDFDQPVAVLMLGVLHLFGEHHDPGEVIGRYTDVLAPGSFLALSHFTDEFAPEPAHDVLAVLPDCAPPAIRDRKTVLAFVEDLELLEPGAVPVADWRPEPADADLRTPEPLSFALLARTVPPPRPNSSSV
ncbi:SAM-dependent methyltransferase [Saccharopolyspora mangrovi]|uniref:SAM-dependent methyltransferase n=1 Tax=Saccharopolyspora mangrovi TaxID=3082379 RepID=A0ABU6AHW4_9PSEU|nr:SAM-dependent methyltransferase [Saccharopolyspora sp. S2-29]MEB3371057.1 SAM-dependent methyltransferase [Saccharopolyspora sp. S2-29]